MGGAFTKLSRVIDEMTRQEKMRLAKKRKPLSPNGEEYSLKNTNFKVNTSDWVKAIDPVTTLPYWWNIRTRATRWSPPPKATSKVTLSYGRANHMY